MVGFHRRMWRHFGPKKGLRSEPVDTGTYGKPNYLPSEIDKLYHDAEHKIYHRLPRHPHVYKLNEHIEEFQQQAKASGQIVDWIAALLIQAPRAVLAQAQMDKHKHGYHDKQARLYELIDFNDTLVDTVLVLNEQQRRTFEDKAKQAADRVCRYAQTACFTDAQWDAITKGLGREIAVFLAGRESGFDAWMTNRVQDAMGIDMQIRDPESKRYINIDVKTPSSFRHRLEELLHEGRISSHGLLIADDVGYVEVYNGHGEHRVPTIILCVLPERSGEIDNFEFKDTAPMRDMLNRLIREHGLVDGNYGAVGDQRSL